MFPFVSTATPRGATGGCLARTQDPSNVVVFANGGTKLPAGLAESSGAALIGDPHRVPERRAVDEAR